MKNTKGAAEVVDRKEGYYWVKFEGEWVVAKYIRFISYRKLIEWWALPEEDGKIFSSEIQEIDERQICRS